MSIESRLEHNVELAPLTTLGVGGRARLFFTAENEADVAAAVAYAFEAGVDIFVLGGGSNVLIADGGFDGLVVHIGIKGVESQGAVVTAGAGEDWDPFVEFAVGRRLAGLECLSGIPGFVGGTPVQNVGAYGQEVSETIATVRCLDRRTMRFVDLSNAECGFAYRKSIFNTEMRGRYIVTSVVFRLVPEGEPKVAYKDLRETFEGRRPTLDEVREAVLRIRRSKSMVIDPADPNTRCAGSFFKNPIVDLGRYNELRERFGDVPRFDAGGGVKVPAAWLIENAGFHKGFALGNAGISTRHTLALINRGNATAAEILDLKQMIQTAVAEKFGIALAPEPVFVGNV